MQGSLPAQQIYRLGSPAPMIQNDSDNDEGFVPTKVQVNSENKIKDKAKGDPQCVRPTDLNTRYVYGDGILRKEPAPIYRRFANFRQQWQGAGDGSTGGQQFTKLQAKTASLQGKGEGDSGQTCQQTKNNEPGQQMHLQTELNNDQGQEEGTYIRNSHQPKKAATIVSESLNLTGGLEKEGPGHPYHKYFHNPGYTLVYSKYRDRLQSVTPETDDIFSNEINLAKVLGKYDADCYSVLKPSESGHPRHQGPSSGQRTHSHSNQHNHPHSGLQQSNSYNVNGGNVESELEFDSRFESGNLLYAFRNKKAGHSYVLFTQNDTNTYGYNQWFYFSVRGTKTGTGYKFSIVNLRKKHSFFRQGMKVTSFSLRDAEMHGNGWSRVGTNIKYQRSLLRKASDKKFRYYTLSFELEFAHDDDTVYLAMNVPYSYSRLTHHLRLCEEAVRREQSKRSRQQGQAQEKGWVSWQTSIIGYSIANNAIPCVTVGTHPSKKSADQLGQSKDNKKKAIIILARQHPGQTWSSFMMEQIMYLLAESRTPSVAKLLEEHTFKIFPMVNVDGVVYGNFRCDLAGFDLNRNWRNPDRNLHPAVHAIKSQIEIIVQQYEVACVLDLHGHSKQYNTFSYACRNDPVTARVLSLMISEINPIFSFPSCTFGVSKYKETTARAVIYKMVGNENIVTVENSFYAATVGGTLVEYSPEVMKDISLGILEGLEKYLNCPKLRAEYQEKIKSNLQEYLEYEQSPKDGAADSGSESEPFADEICIKEKIKHILPKSFKSIQKQLEEEEKVIKKKHVAPKVRNSQKNAKILPNSKTMKSSPVKNIKEKPIQKEQAIEQTNAQSFIQRTSLSHYKKKSKQVGRRQIAQIFSAESTNRKKQELEAKQEEPKARKSLISKVGEVGLPFYIRQKPSLIPIKLKNDSLQIFKDAYNSTTIKNFNYNESNLHRTMAKSSQKKVKIMNYSEHSNLSEQFPLLCVLSEEKKKQTNYNKTHATLEQRAKDKDFSSLPPKFKSSAPSDKLQALRKNVRSKPNSFLGAAMNETVQRGKLKDNASLISTIWRQNFARYGKDLNVFFGGLKP